jgi:hypothetical protein
MDIRHAICEEARYPIDWVFCSRRCQDAFHTLYVNWTRVKGGAKNQAEAHMFNPSDIELGAMRNCLKSFGEAAGEIGFDKPLGQYCEAEALKVIESIVTCYSNAMVEHHEATKFPPVRGMTPTPDPMAHPLRYLAKDLPRRDAQEEQQ